MKFGVWKKRIGLDNFGSYAGGLDNFWSKWITTVQRAIEPPVFPACKNSHFFRIGWFIPGVDHFSNFRIVRDPNYGCRQKFKFIKNIKYEIWSLEKKLEVWNLKFNKKKRGKNQLSGCGQPSVKNGPKTKRKRPSVGAKWPENSPVGASIGEKGPENSPAASRSG